MSCAMTMRQELAAPARDAAVGVWLLALTALVAAMILIGGATRLTDSGLSITEWDFARHMVPPLTDEGWRRAFALYQETTEYQLQNRGMALDEFRFIYLWEWGHRFLGQLVGIVFAVPFVYFAATGRLAGRFLPVLALGLLGGLQGAIGWWMVTSGLHGRLDVSPVRLATHLGMAFLIVALAFRLALSAFNLPRAPSDGGPRGIWLWALGALLYVQILLGALVAGSDAGRAFNDWPTIGGRWIPDNYGQYPDALANLTENLAAIQFHHRTTGYLAAAAVLAAAAAWAFGRGPARRAAAIAAALVVVQTFLGIAAVLLGAPLWISLVHQGVAVLLWLSIVLWQRAADLR